MSSSSPKRLRISSAMLLGCAPRERRSSRMSFAFRQLLSKVTRSGISFRMESRLGGVVGLCFLEHYLRPSVRIGIVTPARRGSHPGNRARGGEEGGFRENARPIPSRAPGRARPARLRNTARADGRRLRRAHGSPRLLGSTQEFCLQALPLAPIISFQPPFLSLVSSFVRPPPELPFPARFPPDSPSPPRLHFS